MNKDDNSEVTGTREKNQLSIFDFPKLLGPYSLAGVDFSKMLERERKSISALTEANKVAYEGWQALLRRQSEIFQETMANAIATARKQDGAKSRAELAKQGFEAALSNMREMAELTTKYQHEAFGIARKRISENMEDLQHARKPE